MNRLIRTVLVEVDFLGDQIGLEHKRSTRFRSLEGGAYSILIIIITTVIGILFSKDIYERKDPIVVLSKEAVETSSVSLGNFPISFMSSLANVPSEIPFKVLVLDLVSVFIYPNTTVSRTVYTSVLEKCNLSSINFPENNKTRDLFNFTQYPGAYCLKNQNLYSFQNPYSTPNSSFLNFRFRKCSKLDTPDCPDNIDQILPSIFMGIYFINSYVNSANFNEPIFYKIDSLNIQMTPGLLKRFYLKIGNNKYTSDNGWILESLQEYSFLNYDSVSIDITTESKSYDGHIFWITLESPALVTKYKRNYNKLQFFIANIGGFANVIKILFIIATKSHLRFLYISFIRDLVLSTNEFETSKIKMQSNKSAVASKVEEIVQKNLELETRQPTPIKTKNDKSNIECDNSKLALDNYEERKSRVVNQGTIKSNNFIANWASVSSKP